MSEAYFDAIVVGAGVAGSIAGYVMAKAGLNVLIIERGDFAGSKNITGGRLYAHSLEKIIPGFASEAPIERIVTHEKLSFLIETRSVTLDFQAQPANDPMNASYTILRSSFDRWLAEKAEVEGAQLICSVHVDGLLKENGKVIGITAGGETINARVVILADGVNSLLGRSIDLIPDSSPHDYALGAKEIISLPRNVLEDRFNLEGDEGVAWLLAGTPSNNLPRGGFLYTNRESVSLGVVCGLANLEKSNQSITQMLEIFKQHPTIRPLIREGKLLEYSAHLVPEGGMKMLPQLVDSGVMLVGDAAGMCLNLGYTVRWMDLALTSGEAAANTIIEAIARQDVSSEGLAGYQHRLEQGSVLSEMKQYVKLPDFLATARLYQDYPALVTEFMSELYTFDGHSKSSLLALLARKAKQAGVINLLKDGLKGMRAL